MTTRRNFLSALAAGVVSSPIAIRGVNAQQPGAPSGGAGRGAARGGRGAAVPSKTVKTTTLFKSPEGYPNGIAVSAQGLWIAEQKSDNAVLVDWNGKLLKTFSTPSKNTSGIAYGDGHVFMAANREPFGIFQLTEDGKLVWHRQIPLGAPDNGGGCHGCEYVDGKLWIATGRMRGILRVDVKTWQPEMFIPYSFPRAHGIAYNRRDQSLWMVTGSEDDKAGLVQYDSATGRILSIATFQKDAADPHGLAWHDDQLLSSDAGVHPGWEENASPTHGLVFRIEFV